MIGLLLISTYSFSQNELATDSCDILVTKNNTTLYVKVIEFTATEIYYKGCISDSSNDSGQWIKRNDLKEVNLRYKVHARTTEEVKYSVQPAIAEIGASFNLDPFSGNLFDFGGEIRFRVKEAESIRHFIYPRFAFINYVAASKPLTTHKYFTSSLGYHAEIKKGRTRWRFSYGGALEFYHLFKDQSNYTSPYGSVYPATTQNYYKFGLVARLGVQYYLSQYCYLQLNFSGGFGSPTYENNKTHSSNWFSFASSHLMSISLFGRLPAR